MGLLAALAIVFLVLCVALADRSKIPAYTARINVWAKPLAFFAVGLALVVIFLR